MWNIPLLANSTHNTNEKNISDRLNPPKFAFECLIKQQMLYYWHIKKTTGLKGYRKNEPLIRSKNRPQLIPDNIICWYIIYQRVTDVCSAAFVRQDIITLIRRLSSSMEHLYGVLPKPIVSRLSLCAHYFHALQSTPSNPDTCRHYSHQFHGVACCLT